jgi:hypothetical protein
MWLAVLQFKLHREASAPRTEAGLTAVDYVCQSSRLPFVDVMFVARRLAGPGTVPTHARAMYPSVSTIRIRQHGSRVLGGPAPSDKHGWSVCCGRAGGRFGLRGIRFGSGREFRL